MFKNVGSNWVLNACTFAVGLVIGPCVVASIGQEGDGVWQMVRTWTVSILGLLVLGVPMASVRYFSKHLAEEDQPTLNRAIGSCFGLYLLLGTIVLVAGSVLYLPFDWGLARLVEEGQVPAALVGDAHVTYVLCVVLVAFQFVAQLPYGIMVAHQEFVLRNGIMICGLLLKLGLVIGLLAVQASVFMLVAAQLGALTFEFAVARFLVRRRYPGTRMSLADFEWASVRRIFTFSIWIFLLQIGIKLSFELDALIVGWFFTAETVSHYTRASGFLVYLMEFVVAIGAVVMPLATRLQVQGRTSELQVIFLKWSKIAFALSMLACAFLGILGGRFMTAWLGEPGYQQPAEQIFPWLMAGSVVFLPVRGVALPMLMGLGRPGLPTVAFCVGGALKIGLAMLLVPTLDLAGVAVGTAIPNVLFALVVLLFACRVTGVGPGRYLAYVMPRVLLGCLPLVGWLAWARYGWGVQGRPGIVLAGILTCGLFAALALGFMFRNDPYTSLPRLRRRSATR